MSSILTDLKSTNSRLEKEKILNDFMSERSNHYLCKHLMLAFDTYKTFGVKKIEEPKFVNSESEDLISSRFEDLANDLIDRRLTGNAARSEIDSFLMHCTADQQSFYKSILEKDLACGVNITTWNKVAKKVNKEFVVDVFSCQLAEDGTKVKENDLSGNKIVEVKLDGVRVLSVVYPSGTCTMYTRNGKELLNFTKISEWFADKVAPQLKQPMVFDGEVMSSSFNDLMTQVHRKENVQADDSVLYVFDIIPLDGFKKGEFDMPLVERKELLAYNADFFNTEIIRQVGYQVVDMADKDKFNRLNKEAIANGYEGLMLKDPDSPYTCKRNKDWLKIKPVIEVTLKVVALEEGTGKNKGSLGALVCEGEDNGVFIRVNVGSGLTDEMRNDIWLQHTQNEYSVVGDLVEVKADAISQNKDGSHSLRFPRFKCFRGFDKGEKM